MGEKRVGDDRKIQKRSMRERQSKRERDPIGGKTITKVELHGRGQRKNEKE